MPTTERPSCITWTADDVAAYLGVSRRTVTAMASAGRLPAIRMGKGLWKFSKNALDEWLVSQSLANMKAPIVLPDKRTLRPAPGRVAPQSVSPLPGSRITPIPKF